VMSQCHGCVFVWCVVCVCVCVCVYIYVYMGCVCVSMHRCVIEFSIPVHGFESKAAVLSTESPDLLAAAHQPPTLSLSLSLSLPLFLSLPLSFRSQQHT